MAREKVLTSRSHCVISDTGADLQKGAQPGHCRPYRRRRQLRDAYVRSRLCCGGPPVTDLNQGTTNLPKQNNRRILDTVFGRLFPLEIAPQISTFRKVPARYIIATHAMGRSVTFIRDLAHRAASKHSFGSV